MSEIAALAWPAALVVLGALTLARSWDSWAASLVLAVAAVAPLLLVRGAIAAGVSPWASSVGAVLLLLLGGYLVTADAGLTFAQVASDVVPRLLTAARPFPLAADLLVGPVLLTALISVLTALRVDSPHRAIPLVGGVALYVAGSLLSAGEADPHGVVAVLLVVLAIGGWVFLDQHDEPGRRRLRVAGPLALGVVVVLAGSALLPVDDGYDPRELVDPPIEDVVAVSPLASIGAWNSSGGEPLFRTSGDAVPMRLAVLDTYDGQQWTARPRFAALGTLADPGLPDGQVVRRATTTVSLDNLSAGFVPTPGRPSAIEVSNPDDVDLLVDVGTGTVFDPTPPAPAVADVATGDDDTLVYTVTGVTDAADDATIEAASVPMGTVAARYLALPQLPADLAAYAAAVTQGAATPYQQAIAIQNEIRGDGTLSSEAISGSSLYRVTTFLLGDDTGDGSDAGSDARVGTSEQFASAFAVVARANGLPARVVVCFKPGAEEADGSREVTGSDALAWPEVYFSEVGWVPFSPTPDDSTFVRQQPDQVQPPPEQPLPAGEPTADVAPSTPAPAPAAPAPAPDSSTPAWPWLLATLVVLALVVLLLARAVRRLRHRRRGAPG